MAELTRYQESTRPSLVDALWHRAQAALSFLKASIQTEIEPEISIQRPVVVDARTAAINALKLHCSEEEAISLYEQSVEQSARIDARNLPDTVFVPQMDGPHDEDSYTKNHEAYMAHMKRVLGSDDQSA